MTIVRWEPLRELNSLQSDMNQLFNAFFAHPENSGGSTPRWVPAMDLVEAGDEYVLHADLPGLGLEDVSIEVEDTVLTLSGERRVKHTGDRDGYVRVERAFGAFSRTLTLPKGIDAEAITASFSNGVLEVRIPKPEQRKPHRIEITPADRQATIDAAAT